MDDNEHDELWDLLGKARQPIPSPFFTRNVLRAVRMQENPGFLGRFGISPSFEGLLRSWTAALAAIVLLIGIAGNKANLLTATRNAVAARLDAQIIANLDELIASEDENAVWLDNDATF